MTPLKRYRYSISQEAMMDINNVHRIIAYKYMQPSTAIKYKRGIMQTIKKLRYLAGVFAPSQQESLKKFSKDNGKVYAIPYKRMAIIYTVKNDEVNILRVIAGKLIK